MKENVLEVLFYLYKYYLNIDTDWDNNQQDDIVEELEEQGFNRSKIAKAFRWVEQLKSDKYEVYCQSDWNHNANRVFLDDECQKLSKPSRGLITFLEQINILKPKTREVVIAQAMALDDEVIKLEHLKWIILMVLSHHPQERAQLDLLGDFVLADAAEYLH